MGWPARERDHVHASHPLDGFLYVEVLPWKIRMLLFLNDKKYKSFATMVTIFLFFLPVLNVATMIIPLVLNFKM